MIWDHYDSCTTRKSCGIARESPLYSWKYCIQMSFYSYHFVLSNSIFWRKKCSDIFYWKLFFRLFGFKFALEGANTIKKIHLGVQFIFLNWILRHSFFSMQHYITPVLDLMPCLKAWGTKDCKQKGH